MNKKKKKKTTKTFLEAALSSGSSSAISTYKKEIADAVDPDAFKPIEFEKEGGTAISDATGKAVPDDAHKQVDLMLHYIECGTNQTLAYGDTLIYHSMIQCVARSTQCSEGSPQTDRLGTLADIDRLPTSIAARRSKIGWGYSD
ncbi:MAG: hypothetical protein R3F11_31505 [Verrucomicrobiales bacterium]